MMLGWIKKKIRGEDDLVAASVQGENKISSDSVQSLEPADGAVLLLRRIPPGSFDLYEVHLNLAKAALLTGRDDTVAATVNELGQANRQVALLLELVDLALRAGKTAKSQQLLQQASEIAANGNYMGSDRAAAACGSRRCCAPVGASVALLQSHFFIEIAARHLHLNDTAAAKKLLERARQRDPESMTLEQHLRLAVQFQRSGEGEAAESQMATASAVATRAREVVESDDVRGFAGVALGYDRIGRSDLAAAAMAKAQEKAARVDNAHFPHDEAAIARYELVLGWVALRRFAEAETAAASLSDPNWQIMALVALLTAYRAADQQEGAEKTLTRLLALEAKYAATDHPEQQAMAQHLHSLIAQDLGRSGRLPEALSRMAELADPELAIETIGGIVDELKSRHQLSDGKSALAEIVWQKAAEVVDKTEACRILIGLGRDREALTLAESLRQPSQIALVLSYLAASPAIEGRVADPACGKRLRELFSAP